MAGGWSAVIEAIIVTIFPALFLIILFGGGMFFSLKKIDQDGAAPINRTLFYASKYSIIILWGTRVLQSWGVSISQVAVPALAKWTSLSFWFFGFALLFIGRFGLGNSFRLGIPKEGTGLKVDGIYRLSRNPMYLGVYATVLAEEEHMQKKSGQEYVDYCHRVGRYV